MNAHKHSSKDNPHFQAGFALGHLYRAIKEELNAIGAASGGAISANELASRLAALFAAEESGSLLGSAERLSEMRSHSAERSSARTAKALHVRPHAGRTLSAAARKSISAAQRKRWREQKRRERQQSRRPFVMTPARLRTARQNAAKARAAKAAKAKAVAA